MQCCIEILQEQPSCTLDIFETTTKGECCHECDYVNSDVSDNEEVKQITSPSKAAFIVYWTYLIVLLKKCLHSDVGYNNKSCFQRISIDFQIIMPQRPWIRMEISAKNYNHYSVGNLASATSVLFSVNTYQRLAWFFDLVGIQWLSKTHFYTIQNCYLYCIVIRNYIEKSKAILWDMKLAKLIDLSGDGRRNSPWHNAKYLTHYFMDKSKNKSGAYISNQCFWVSFNIIIRYIFLKISLKFIKTFWRYEFLLLRF